MVRLATFGSIRCCFILVLLLASSREASGAAIVSFSGGSVFTGFSNDETVGWRFTVTTGLDIAITSLGWWDQSPGTPLAASHQVGVWALDGSLLGSTTVQPTSPLTGSFRYEGIAPIVLTAGTSYVIGGRDLVVDGDSYATSVASLVTDPRITFNLAARSPNNTGFAFPNIFEANSGGRFGPNFEFREVAVPEPATLALFAAGLAGMGTRRWRHRKR